MSKDDVSARVLIETVVQEGRALNENGFYFGALFLALALPGMCSRIEFHGLTEYKKSNGEPNDTKCYTDFCEEYLNDTILKRSLVNIESKKSYAEILYKLRCTLIHEGKTCYDIVEIKENQFFTIEHGLDGKITIDMREISDLIFSDIVYWLEKKENRRT